MEEHAAIVDAFKQGDATDISGGIDAHVHSSPKNLQPDSQAVFGQQDSMSSVLVLADDLTGSLDTGVQFSKRNIPCSVAHYSSIPAASQSPAVLVVNTESRHLSSDEAYDRVYSTLAACAAHHAHHYYKKTDSALRGNIGTELQALSDFTSVKSCVFAPAYPAQKRTTTEGHQYVNGAPLEATDFARDPRNPVATGDVCECLSRDCPIHCHNISSPTELNDYLENLGGSHRELTVAVVDAMTETAMAGIATALHTTKKRILYAGCAGLATHLSNTFAFPRVELSPPKLCRPVLVAVGSLHPASLDQANFAMESGYPVIAPSHEAASSTCVPENDKWKHLVETAAVHLGRSGALVLRSTDPTTPNRIVDDAQHALSYFGRLVSESIRLHDVRTLVVFGGDSLACVFDQFGWPAVVPYQELEGGMVLASVTLGNRPLTLVSKAGGFGMPGILTRLLDRTAEEALQRNSG